jgi:hypothetical protein
MSAPYPAWGVLGILGQPATRWRPWGVTAAGTSLKRPSRPPTKRNHTRAAATLPVIQAAESNGG